MKCGLPCSHWSSDDVLVKGENEKFEKKVQDIIKQKNKIRKDKWKFERFIGS